MLLLQVETKWEHISMAKVRCDSILTLESCLMSGHMSVFPVQFQHTVRRHIVRQIAVQLYCVCKTSYVSGEGMVYCDVCHVWYHPSGAGLSEGEFVECFEQRAKNYKYFNCH